MRGADGDAKLIGRIGDLARNKGWTVILAAEHNDLGGSAKRIAALTRRTTVRNDLTVPPGIRMIQVRYTCLTSVLGPMRQF
jgi:hypothetical protein